MHGRGGAPKVVLAGLLAVAGLIAGCSRGPQQPTNVLLVTLDTLRADRIGSYGHAAATTPVLDALAARGARFASATTTTPLTLAAHTSLFTGTFPAHHGVRDNTGFHVEDSLTTVAEILKARGFRTGGFVGAFVLDARWGIAQGFDTYVDDFDLTAAGPGLDTIQRRGGEVVDKALAWLGQDATRPFFGWVHLYDPHAPYDAPEPFASRFPATMDGAYDAEVAYTDSQVGRLVDALRASNRLDDTLVVVLSDHGEQLGEHREQAHGFFVYDASVQIPLILAGPGVPTRVIRDQVRIVDVAPTILDLAGVPIPDEMQGTSLTPALRGEPVELLGFAESWYPRYHYGWSELLAVRDGRFKFILAPRRELYDISADPGERHNLAAADQPRADAMERALRALVARTSRAEAAKGPQEVSPEVEQRLRALGYVGGTTSAKNLEDAPRADPKDRIELYNLLKLAGSDSEAGRYDDAAAKVRQALAADPGIIDAHAQLGNIYSRAQRWPEAVAAYQRALALDPEHAQSTFNLALAYRAMGRVDDALVGFERSRQLEPRSGRAHFQIGDILMQRGEFARAVAALTPGLSLDIERPPFLVKLGEAHLELQQLDEAERILKEAVELDPQVPRGQYDLGLVYERRGQVAQARAAFEAEAAHNPKNSGAPFTLGQMLLKDGRPREAAQRFRAAIAAQPDFAEAHLYLAKALLDIDDVAGAEQAARAGLKLQPQRSIAPLGHYVLADVYSRLGREHEAAREVARARALERGR